MVRQAEQALAQWDFSHGPIDGRLDADTHYGLRQVQQSYDLAVTGGLNMETLAVLGIEQSEYGRRAHASGDELGASAGSTASSGLYSAENIRAVEQALKQRNYVVGPVNSEIEPDTQYGLRQFQLDRGLEPTGNFNFETLEALGVQPDA